MWTGGGDGPVRAEREPGGGAFPGPLAPLGAQGDDLGHRNSLLFSTWLPDWARPGERQRAQFLPTPATVGLN